MSFWASLIPPTPPLSELLRLHLHVRMEGSPAEGHLKPISGEGEWTRTPSNSECALMLTSATPLTLNGRLLTGSGGS